MPSECQSSILEKTGGEHPKATFRQSGCEVIEPHEVRAALSRMAYILQQLGFLTAATREWGQR